jgi:hypothetical protein
MVASNGGSRAAGVLVDDIAAMAAQLDRVRDLLREVRPILAARRGELGPLLAALGLNVFDDPRPTLTEHALAEFEATHSLRLPADYRAFLGEVGNGGPGPGYGMSELRAPFPQTTLDPRRLLPPDRVNTLVQIAGLGCGMEWQLVVAGPDAGNVWFHDEDGFAPCDPRRGFLDWYEGWLTATRRLGRVAPGAPGPDDDA